MADDLENSVSADLPDVSADEAKDNGGDEKTEKGADGNDSPAKKKKKKRTKVNKAAAKPTCPIGIYKKDIEIVCA